MVTYDNVGNIDEELTPEEVLQNVTSFPAYEAAVVNMVDSNDITQEENKEDKEDKVNEEEEKLKDKDSVVSKGNEISARELMSLYSNVINSFSLYLYEYKHGEAEGELRSKIAALREEIKKARKQGISDEEELSALRLVEKMQNVLDKYDERKKHLDAASRLTPENAKKASELLAEILSLNNIKVNPIFILAAILLTPVANSLVIIFLDKTRFKTTFQ